MGNHDLDSERVDKDLGTEKHGREHRLELLIGQLPPRLQASVRWLRQPSMRAARIVVAVLLIVGSLFSILPILGLWMLPLGLLLLADDIKFIRLGADRILAWIEHRRPHWMGLSDPPRRQQAVPGDWRGH
jgi:hypothetical protein